MASEAQSSSINNFKRSYRLGSSTASTKIEVKQSHLNVLNNQSASKMIERSGSSKKHIYFKEVAKKSDRLLNVAEPKQSINRPTSQYNIRTISKKSQTDIGLSEYGMSANNIKKSKQVNVHLKAHLQRTGHLFKPKVLRTQSATVFDKRCQTAHHKKRENIAETNSKLDREINDFEKELKIKAEAIEENESAVSSKVKDVSSEEVHSPEIELRKEFLRNPQECLESTLVRLKKAEVNMGIYMDDIKKQKEDDLNEEMKKQKLQKFTGKYKDFELALPWEKVSFVVDDNSVRRKAYYEEEVTIKPILEVDPAKEREVEKLTNDYTNQINFYKDFTQIEYDQECKYLKVEQTRLTLLELMRLRKEFEAKANGSLFDLQAVESIVKPLMFFMKFDEEVRHSILKNAELVEYPAGHVVFKQGDFGDNMYIILKGSVNAVLHYNDPITAEAISRVVAWMRDGVSFGEYSMLGTKSRTIKDNVFTNISKTTNEINNRLVYLKRAIIYNEPIDLKKNNPVDERKRIREQEEREKDMLISKSKQTEEPVYQERKTRAADIVCAEEVALLQLPREYFREIILNTIKDEYEKKMRLLSELTLFKSHELLSLMPIANFMQKQEFKLGEAILMQGSHMHGISMIYQGRCKVVLVVTNKRDKEVSSHVKGLKPKLANFNFGKEEQFEVQDIGYFRKMKENIKKRPKKMIRQFTYTEIEATQDQDPGFCHYEDHIPVKIMERGGVFGTRTTNQFNMQLKDGFNASDSIIEPAKLSIIAETSKVVLYYFDMKNYKYLPEEVKRTLLNEAKNGKDFDSEVIKQIRKQGELWDEFKQKTYADTVISQYHKRNVDSYKKF